MIFGKSLGKSLAKSLAKSFAGGDKKKYTVTFSCQHGTVIATVDGVEIQSGAKIEEGKSVVFTIYPSAHYHYHYTNPETVLVDADVTRNYVCDIDVFFVDFSCTNGSVGATVDGIGIQSGGFVDYGKTVVFIITPNEGYEYTGTNPESVVVHDNVEKNYECTPIVPPVPYLTFTSTGANKITINMIDTLGDDEEIETPVEVPINEDGWDVDYSTDNGSTWTAISWVNIPIEIPMSDGQKVLFKGTMESTFTPYFSGYSVHFTTSSTSGGTVEVSGDLTTVLNQTGGVTSLLYYPNYALAGFFAGSTNLVSAANLVIPATEMPSGCLQGLFRGCTSLVSAPNLPATSIYGDSYAQMFKNCSALTGTVNISATSPYSSGSTSSACGSMFQNAGTAEGAGGTINVGGSTAEEWASAAEIDTTKWTIVAPVPYLTFTSTGATVISTAWPSSNDDEAHVSESNDGWEYSYDKSTWNAMTWYQTQVPLTDGQSVYFRGTEKTGGHSGFTVSGDGTVAVSGDVTVMLNNVGGVLDLTSYGSDALSKLFSNCSKITSANLVLPSTTLTQLCYSEMFYGCTRLAGTITIAASAPGQSCLMMFVDASTVAGAGGTINVGGSTAEEWASAAEIDTTKWTINVINEDE